MFGIRTSNISLPSFQLPFTKSSNSGNEKTTPEVNVKDLELQSLSTTPTNSTIYNLDLGTPEAAANFLKYRRTIVRRVAISRSLIAFFILTWIVTFVVFYTQEDKYANDQQKVEKQKIGFIVFPGFGLLTVLFVVDFWLSFGKIRHFKLYYGLQDEKVFPWILRSLFVWVVGFMVVVGLAAAGLFIG